MLWLFVASRTNHSIMNAKMGPRAARARKLVSGRAWDSDKPHQTSIVFLPGLLELAEQYGICAPKGKNAEKSISDYFQDKLIADIRAYEKKRDERIKERLEGSKEAVKNLSTGWDDWIVFFCSPGFSRAVVDLDVFDGVDDTI